MTSKLYLDLVRNQKMKAPSTSKATRVVANKKSRGGTEAKQTSLRNFFFKIDPQENTSSPKENIEAAFVDPEQLNDRIAKPENEDEDPLDVSAKADVQSKVDGIGNDKANEERDFSELSSPDEAEKSFQEEKQDDEETPADLNSILVNEDENNPKMNSGKDQEIVENTTKKAFPCPECDKSFARRPHLEGHLSALHGIGETYSCEPCQRTFKTWDSFREHKRKIHEGIKKKKLDIVKCDICLHTCTSKESLDRHIKMKHFGIKVYTCDQCDDTSLSSKQSLKIHMERVHKNSKPTFKCNTCKGKFFSQALLNKHIRTVHDKIKLYACDQCSTTCSDKSKLEDHKKQVHLQLKPHKCTECEMAFKRLDHLKNHLSSKHGKGETFTCQTCGSIFKVKNHLTTHMKRQHAKANGQKCDICDYVTQYPDYLVKHKRVVHENQKVFKCSFCEKAFSFSRNKDEHEMLMHKREEQEMHECGICDKKFVLRRKMAEHQKKHEKQNQFACANCTKIFLTKSDLNEHHDRVHAMNVKEEEEF